MIKKIVILLASSLLIAACAKQPPKTQNGLPHHSQDTKGRNIFPEHRQPTGNRVFIFSPKYTAWAAYDAKGNRVKTGRASGGKDYCEDVNRACRTVIGKFQIYHKRGADCESSKYPVGEGGAPMPHCMFFKGGYAIHGSPYVPDNNASHGCIRVTPSAAKWLSNHFIRNGTTVIVQPYS